MKIAIIIAISACIGAILCRLTAPRTSSTAARAHTPDSYPAPPRSETRHSGASHMSGSDALAAAGW
jgi:hypothetical protein